MKILSVILSFLSILFTITLACSLASALPKYCNPNLPGGQSCIDNSGSSSSSNGSSFNDTYATWLFNYTQFNKFWYNMSDGSYNATYLSYNTTYGKFWYNMTVGGGSGTPASPNRSIQFNLNGAFGGENNLTYGYTNGKPTVFIGTDFVNKSDPGTRKKSIIADRGILIDSEYSGGVVMRHGSNNATDVIAGFITEVEGLLLDYGSNFGQLGYGFNSNFAGGLMRLELRPEYANQFFALAYLPPNHQTENFVFQVSTGGSTTAYGNATVRQQALVWDKMGVHIGASSTLDQIATENFFQVGFAYNATSGNATNPTCTETELSQTENICSDFFFDEASCNAQAGCSWAGDPDFICNGLFYTSPSPAFQETTGGSTKNFKYKIRTFKNAGYGGGRVYAPNDINTSVTSGNSGIYYYNYITYTWTGETPDGVIINRSIDGGTSEYVESPYGLGEFYDYNDSGLGWTTSPYDFRNQSFSTYEQFRVQNNSYVGINGSASYPLTVNANENNISIWSQAKVSATGYITRTDVYDTDKLGLATDNLKSDKELLYANGSINHKAFPEYIEYDKTIITGYNKTLVDKEVCVITNRTKSGKRCWINKVEDGSPLYATVKEEGVDLGKLVAKHEQSSFEMNEKIKELELRVADLERRLNLLDGLTPSVDDGGIMNTISGWFT